MRQKELLIISITIFLTIVAWIVSDIYHVAKTEKLGSLKSKTLEPININIDHEIINALEKKG